MPDRDDDRIERDLARLAAATADLSADDSFTEAVLCAAKAAKAADDPLTRLARATDAIEPDPAFTDAILRAVKAAPAPAQPAIVADGIVRSGRAAIVLAALAAAASVLLFFRTQSQLDAAIVTSVDTIEVGE